MKKLSWLILLFANLTFSGQCLAEFVNSEAQEKAAAEAKKVAEHNAKTATIIALVGRSFYAHFPRESCRQGFVVIKSQPSYLNKEIFSAPAPIHARIEQIVLSDEAKSYHFDPTDISNPLYFGYFYYQVKLDDGTIGYVLAEYFPQHLGTAEKEYELKTGCWSPFNPVELQAQIEKIESDRKAKQEEAARLELLEKQKLAEEQARQTLTLQQEQERNAPETLRNMGKDEFCAAYGQAMREENVYDVGNFPNVLKLVKAEARRRNLTFNDTLAKKGSVRMGSSECQMYAGYGLPDSQNRTVGPWGVHIQHIYGNQYIYTENGRVTSWQN